MKEDTIVAISTPIGEGGIGIVRVSGPDAVPLAEKIFVPKKNRTWAKGPGYRLVYGTAVDPKNGMVIDEVLLSLMRSPYSYTTEDVVEFNCHGGIIAVRKVLEAMVGAGARLAEPGEFSLRAVLGGRIDLCQAEAVLDVIRAKTEEGLRVAQAQLQGRLSSEVQKLRRDAVALLSALEAGIDFPEDVPGPEHGELISEMENILLKGKKLLENAEAGSVYRDGITTVLAGKANVGKSSILNALAGKERAIVTAIPGTTRDVIEEVINMSGIPLRVMDTAGIREAVEEVERIGVARAREALAGAQLVLVVLDAVAGIGKEDEAVFSASTGRQRIVVVNKTDTGKMNVGQDEIKSLAGDARVVFVSALTGDGMDDLRQAICEKVFQGAVVKPDEVLVSRARHTEAIHRFVGGVEAAIDGLKSGVPEDLISIDLRAGITALGEITGENVTEDVIESIFRDFCVGK
ncbi:MAG: tRNA uridine-5-carboxymethylaminomethyl(34) synthesis GTPase MnmE [Bacillota bacterium]